MADPEKIAGRWIYESGLLRRPDPSPRLSRGRIAFVLRPDGTFEEEVPGPTDRPTSTGGKWRVAEDTITLTYDDGRPSLSLPCSTDESE